jgi:hypothetical protein
MSVSLPFSNHCEIVEKSECDEIAEVAKIAKQKKAKRLAKFSGKSSNGKNVNTHLLTKSKIVCQVQHGQGLTK